MRSFFRRLPPWADSALLAGLAAAFWLEFLLGRRALFYDTLFRMFYPNAVFLRNEFRGLEFPFWNPHIYGGVPFFANPQTALLYPGTLLYAFLDFGKAVAWDVWLHTALAAVFMARLAEEEGFSRPAALFAGFLYAFNGYFVRHYAYPSNLHAYSWAPLVLLWSGRAAVHWAAMRLEAARAAAVAGAFLALQIFSGHPQFVFYTVLAAWVYAFSKARGPFAPMLLIKGIALILAAVQWVPAMAFALDSPRRHLGYDWATSYSLAPIELLRMLFVPQWNMAFVPQSGDPHVVGFYFGLPVLALAAGGLKSGRSRSFAAIAALGLVLSLGRYLPSYRALYLLFPPFRLFRFPANALFLFSLSVPILAASGLGKKPLLSGLLALLCAVDLWSFGRRSIISIDPAFYRTVPPAAEFLEANAGSARVYLTPRSRAETRRFGRSELEAWLKLKDSVLPNLAMVFNLRDAAGEEQMRYAAYDQVLEELAQSPLSPWLDLLGIRYVLTLWGMPGKFRTVFRGDVNLYENPAALPRAYWVPADAVLDGAQRPRGYAPARLLEDGANRVVSELAAPRPGYLVLADSFDSGWQALVNGERVPILRAHLVQRAVSVPAGPSRVEFRYRPPFFYPAALLSLAGGAGVLLFALFGANLRTIRSWRANMRRLSEGLWSS